MQILDRVIGGRDNAALRALVRDNLSSAIERVQVTPLIGRVLEMLVVNDPDDTLLSGLVELAQRKFDENRGNLRETVGARTPWWLPGFVDERIYKQLVTEVERGEQLKHDLLRHPQLRRYLNAVTRDVSAFFTSEVRDPDSAFRTRISDALVGMGEGLAREPALRDEINASLRDAGIYVLTRYRNRITHVVSDTVSGWDANTAADLIEQRVGRDLQFIRINGTLVGGLAGLTLYTLWHALM